VLVADQEQDKAAGLLHVSLGLQAYMVGRSVRLEAVGSY
jgi:hypothetical protein